MKNLLLPLAIALSPTLLSGEGIHDLVKPDLDTLREAAETERLKEEARQQKLREEEEARRLEVERREAELEAAKKDPLVDVETLKLAGDIGGKESYKIESGGTLGAVSSDRYGSSQYYLLIEYWNKVNANKIYVGQVIKTPGIATIMKVKGKKVLSRYPDEVSGMLQLREDFLKVESELVGNKSNMSEELKAEMERMYQNAKKIHAGFLVKRPGVREYANGLLGQCKNVVDQLEAMRKGDLGRSNSRVSRFHYRLAFAMRNAMIWGEEDFK